MAEVELRVEGHRAPLVLASPAIAFTALQVLGCAATAATLDLLRGVFDGVLPSGVAPAVLLLLLFVVPLAIAVSLAVWLDKRASTVELGPEGLKAIHRSGTVSWLAWRDVTEFRDDSEDFVAVRGRGGVLTIPTLTEEARVSVLAFLDGHGIRRGEA